MATNVFSKKAMQVIRYFLHTIVITSFILTAAVPITKAGATSAVRPINPSRISIDKINKLTSFIPSQGQYDVSPHSESDSCQGSSTEPFHYLSASLGKIENFRPTGYWGEFTLFHYATVAVETAVGVVFDYSVTSDGMFSRYTYGLYSPQPPFPGYENANPIWNGWYDENIRGEGQLCSSINYAGLTGDQICNQLAPGAYKNNSIALGPIDANSVILMGFIHRCEDPDYYTCIATSSNLTISNIRIIYYGYGSGLNASSALSINQPKNGPGDPRECAINGCNEPATQSTYIQGILITV
jgi:hypothetical protein